MSSITDSGKLKYVMLASTLFVVLNTYFIALEQFWFMALPAVLLAIVTAFLALEYLMLFIVFATPFSVLLQQYDFGVALYLPTEPLLFGVMIIYILRLFYEGKVDYRITLHPVTLAILFNLFWIFITCITSSLPLVSWKFLLSRLWLVIPFYFVTIHMFRDPAMMKKHIWMYLLSFSVIILYSLVNHALEGFSEEAAHISMTPFYNDHTSYGAMLAMYLPPLLYFAYDRDFSRPVRVVAWVLILLYLTGLAFSYTRAAWLSIIAAMGVLAVYLLRIRTAPILMAIGVALAVFFIYRTDIMISLESGRYKNTENRNFQQRVQSIANITTDASNTERFNRWAAAIRMFNERPFFGWGPGTYQFRYAPFQISTEKTVISTNFGERGNAHSEYIGPLAETGILGLVTFAGIIITTILTAGRIVYRMTDKKKRWFAIVISLGLITYFVHGTLNNFLDTDKASAPFWGFIAMLVAMDLQMKREQKDPAAKELTGQ